MLAEPTTWAKVITEVAIAAGAIVTTIGMWIGLRKSRVTAVSVVPARSTKPRILIIDDDAGDLDIARRGLNGNYTVFTERLPYRALADIATEYDAGRSFDLIIIDYMMEPVTGLRMAQIIRLMETESGLRSPMVFFTRMGQFVEKSSGVLDVWRKPEDQFRLREKVDRILAR
jgi:PleD family two-component response regulator